MEGSGEIHNQRVTFPQGSSRKSGNRDTAQALQHQDTSEFAAEIAACSKDISRPRLPGAGCHHCPAPGTLAQLPAGRGAGQACLSWKPREPFAFPTVHAEPKESSARAAPAQPSSGEAAASSHLCPPSGCPVEQGSALQSLGSPCLVTLDELHSAGTPLTSHADSSSLPMGRTHLQGFAGGLH